jgi:hypothetical protein
MLTPTREKIEGLLRSEGVDLGRLARDPRTVDAAVAIVHGRIPAPLRWIVGRERVRQAVMRISAREIYRRADDN